MYIKDIKDPEHPYSLEQLNVVREEAIEVDDTKGYIKCVILTLYRREMCQHV